MKYSRLAMIAFNALDAGPKWIPAERNGKKVKAIPLLFLKIPFLNEIENPCFMGLS